MLFCLSLSSPLFAADYLFVVIDFPDATFTEARGVNARGDVVGGYDDANEVRHAFLLSKGVYTSIDVPGAAETIGARGINARGDIVGNFTDADELGHGYLLSNGEYTQIDYPDASSTTAFGINNAGDIVGQWFDADGNGSGFILKNGRFHDVQFPDGANSSVWGAEDNGKVLAGSMQIPADGGATHGFLRTRSGSFHVIDFPGTRSPCTGTRWINQRGDIVGLYTIVDRPEDCTGDAASGFVLRDGIYASIDVPGATTTKLLAINDDGVLAGAFVDRRGIGHGFKAVPSH